MLNHFHFTIIRFIFTHFPYINHCHSNHPISYLFSYSTQQYGITMIFTSTTLHSITILYNRKLHTIYSSLHSSYPLLFTHTNHIHRQLIFMSISKSSPTLTSYSRLFTSSSLFSRLFFFRIIYLLLHHLHPWRLKTRTPQTRPSTFIMYQV